MKTIPLTRGYETIVDDDVADLTEMLGWDWCANVQPTGGIYVFRSITLEGLRFHIWLHRWILGITDRRLVDHRDRDGLHNWRTNLRIATRSQNAANSNVVRSNTGFRGVYPNKRRFMARIELNQKSIHLGTYDTPEEASQVYEAKRRELFGEFAP
jgi:hypothetical protein